MAVEQIVALSFDFHNDIGFLVLSSEVAGQC